MKLSIIVTAFKEPETIKQLFESILNPENGNVLLSLRGGGGANDETIPSNESISLGLKAKVSWTRNSELPPDTNRVYMSQNYQEIASSRQMGILSDDLESEILLVCPDFETLESAQQVVKKYNFQNLVYIKDPQKGKPFALKLAFEKAKGEIWILTDGDTFWGEKVVPNLLQKFDNPEVGGVSGHPISIDSKNNMFGYWGHLLADSAHHKRANSMQKNEFFPMSGYLMAIRKPDFEVPSNVLSDDAYISYKILESGLKIDYAENAKVFIKYPKNLSDWYKQKARSLGGYLQLKSLGVLKNVRKTRTFFDELKYARFPIQYAKNPKELVWSFALFPARLFLWAKIFWERKILKKNFEKTWVRIESTK